MARWPCRHRLLTSVANRLLEEALGLARYGEAGKVIGKRAGCTQNLSLLSD